MDGVQLSFDRSAMETIASQAIERNTGARGLRSIMESMMLPIMYELPSREDVAEVIVNSECVLGTGKPQYVTKELLIDKTNVSGELTEA